MIDSGLELLQPLGIAAGLIALQLADDRLEIARRHAGLTELAAQCVGAPEPFAQLARELPRRVAAHAVGARVAFGAALRRRELRPAFPARIVPLSGSLRTLRPLRTL